MTQISTSDVFEFLSKKWKNTTCIRCGSKEISISEDRIGTFAEINGELSNKNPVAAFFLIHCKCCGNANLLITTPIIDWINQGRP